MEHKHFKFRQLFSQAGRKVLRFPHRVDDHACTATLPQRVLQRFRQLFLRQGFHRHPARRCVQRNAGLLHLFSIGPGQQRVAAAGFPGCIRQRFPVEICGHKFGAPLGGQCGRKQDHRHPVLSQPVQCPVQITIHVGVVSMTLVDHHHLARQAEMPQHHMLLLQGRHQQLIHRANDKVGQKRLFAALKPLVHHHPFLRVVDGVFHRHRFLLQFQIVCIQLRHAVRQPDGVFQPIRLFLRPVQQPPKNAVGGGLGRQTKEDAALPAALCQNLRRCQRGLGFAHAHLGFQNKNARFLCVVHSLQHSLLHFVRKKAEPLPELRRVRRGLLHFPGKGRREFLPCPFHAGRIKALVAQFLYRDQREIPGIAGDPVRHDEQAGQKEFRRDRQLRQLFHVRKAAFLQGVIEQFLPAAPPECFPSFGPVVRFVHSILQLVQNIICLLRLAVVCPHDRGQPFRAAQLPQDRLPGQRMVGKFLFLLVPAELGILLQPLFCLRQQAHDRAGKGQRDFPDIVDPPQKNDSPGQQFLVQVQIPPHTFRQPLLHQKPHNACCVPQMHPERQPQTAVVRVCFACKTPYLAGSFRSFHRSTSKASFPLAAGVFLISKE